MSGKIPWLVSLIGSLATAELLLSQRPASHKFIFQHLLRNTIQWNEM